MGEDLNDLEIDELRGLEQNLDNSLKIVRERKVGCDFFFFVKLPYFNNNEIMYLFFFSLVLNLLICTNTSS